MSTASATGSARSSHSRAASGRPWCMYACPRAVHAASGRNGSSVSDPSSVGSIRGGKRLGVFRAQVEQESEPVQQQPPHRMAREHRPAVRSRVDRRCVLHRLRRAGERRTHHAVSRARSRARCVPDPPAPGRGDSTRARSGSYIRRGSRAAKRLPRPPRSSASAASGLRPRSKCIASSAAATAVPSGSLAARAQSPPCGEVRRERTARVDRRGPVGRGRDGRNTASRANCPDPAHAEPRARAARATAVRTRPRPTGRRVRARAPACRCEIRAPHTAAAESNIRCSFSSLAR